MCTPDCASSGLSCTQPHQRCSDTSGTAACVCTLGYQLVGADCVWKEVPLDATFENNPAGAWTLKNGATLDPQAAGLGELGNLVLGQSAICTSGGQAQQTITMPTFTESEPLALNVIAQGTCTFAGMFSCSLPEGPGVRINGSAVPVPYSNTLKLEKICLGERAYGGSVDLSVGPVDRSSCSNTVSYVIDHVGIKPEPSCPAPATLANGDFETTGGWVASPNGGKAEIAAGMGQAGTVGGHIGTTKGCQAPQLVNSGVSFPWRSTANLALSLAFKGSPGGAMVLGDGAPGGSRPGWVTFTGDGGAFQTYNVCVPEYVKGMVNPVALSSATGGNCTVADVRDFYVDDLGFVSEPTCPADASIIDGGFERTRPVLSYWRLTLSQNGTTGKVSATILNDPASAHSGNRALQLSAAQSCTSASAEAIVTVPPPVGAAGPAVRFFYKTTANGNTIFSTRPGGALTHSAAYVQHVTCLDPALVGRGIAFRVSASGGGGTCATTFAADFGTFDDFEVTTDASCPAF